MKANTYITIILIVFLVSSCEKEKVNESATSTGGTVNTGGNGTDQFSKWSIPKDEVLDGGPGKDGIPALTNPLKINASEATYLLDDDLILGFIDGNRTMAYPHSILNYHEIINDDINDISMAVIYCPLTGTGIGWDRKINNEVTSFGVSGLLYNSNVIPYDRNTDSNWSQMLLKSVNGPLINTQPKTINLVETKWSTWKKMYPLTKVVSTNTGHERNYSDDPYGPYKFVNGLLFPVNNTDSRLAEKDRVLGILISDQAKAYSIEEFSNTSGSISLITDRFQDTDLVIVGSEDLNFVVAFENRMSNGSLLEFRSVQDSLPIIMIDNEGTSWDIMGNVVDGRNGGKNLKTQTQLEKHTQFMGYWFAWAAFYPSIELYSN